MLLHGGGGVESGQWVVELLQIAVTEAPVVQVVTQTRDQQAFALQGIREHGDIQNTDTQLTGSSALSHLRRPTHLEICQLPDNASSF